MPGPISRRAVLAAGAGAAAGLTLPGAALARGRATTAAGFSLTAATLDGGEQVVSLTIAAAGLGRIDPASLAIGTFSVHAKATSPLPIAPGDAIYSEYDLDRTVTAIHLDDHGDIVVELSYAEGQLGGGTLGYIASKGRNVQLDLAYTIKQNGPIALRNGRTLTITDFQQGALTNAEVDAFSYHTAASGMKYRLFAPGHARGKRPLVVWLHGGGEGGLLPDGYYDNETTLRANRGALGFATATAQRIFAGAYVVAPQSQSYWLEDGPAFAPQVEQIVKDVVAAHDVDTSRIYVAGCSNGGYMSMEMTVAYPELFAASVPICGVIQSLQDGGPRVLTDAQLAAIDTPSWLVASRDDDTVPPESNTIHAADVIPGAILSLYDHVIWNGYQYPGHWSWIYVARNDPEHNGTHVWQWMAKQRR